ncbi:MAG TPA: hypothetical protein VJ873_01125 [bacterium]|nr:hypothetical protein [bacterium]
MKKLFLILLVSMAGCAGVGTKSSSLTGITITAIQPTILKGFEKNPDTAQCRDFTLSEKEIQSFLSHATTLEPGDLDSEYLWTPCVVNCRVVTGDEITDLQVNALMCGHLRYKDGRETWLKCDEQCWKAGRQDFHP